MCAVKVRSFEDFVYSDLMTYAGIDTIVTYELFKRMYPDLRSKPKYKEYVNKTLRDSTAPSLLEEALEIKADALHFMVDMMCNGIQYDIALNEQYNIRMQAHLNELEESIFTAVGKRWNLDSDLETEQVLFGDFGLECDIKTKGGKASTSGEALQDMAKRYGHS